MAGGQKAWAKQVLPNTVRCNYFVQSIARFALGPGRLTRESMPLFAPQNIRYIFALWLAFTLLCPSAAWADRHPHELSGAWAQRNLIREEVKWLEAHPVIRLGIGAKFVPIMYVDQMNGHRVFQGMVSDYVKLIAHRLGVELKPVFGISFKEALSLGRQQKIDLYPCVALTPARRDFLSYTSFYLSFPQVIITRKDYEFVSGMDDLAGRRVAVVKALATYDRLSRDYPETEFHFVESIPQGLEDVSLGRADACMVNLAVASYYIQKKGLTNLKVAAPSSYQNNELAMGVRKDWPLLVGILNKALISITPQEHNRIRQKWIAVRYEHGLDWGVILPIAGLVGVLVVLVVGVVLHSNRRLRREVEFRKQAENQKAIQLSHLEHLKEIDRVVIQTHDLDQLLSQVMERIFEVFKSDRAWLLYPCDPKAENFWVPYEVTHPKYPGALATGEVMPVEPVTKAVFQAHLATDGPLTFSLEGPDALMEASARYGAQSQLSIAIRPRVGSPWLLGLHQCSHNRHWTNGELNLFTDISHRLADALSNVLLNQNLQESEERFRSLSENAPDIICTLDMNGAFTYANPAWARVLGHQPRTLIGRPFFDLVASQDAASAAGLFGRILKDGEVVKEHPISLVHEDGSSRFFSLSGAPNLNSADQVKGLVAICQDMSARRELEGKLRQAQKMQAIGTLAGGVAHDFNNILAAIMGYSELALSLAASQEKRNQAIAQIVSAAERARVLVRQILTFSRQVDANPTPLDLNQQVRRALEILGRTIPKMISFETHLGHDLPPVKADATQMEQVLLNLASNAADAMPSGGKLVFETSKLTFDDGQVASGIGLAPGDYVLLQVSDTGIGMDQKVREQVFDPFFTTKEPGKGTGLGLSTVFGIVNSHGGNITCYSEVGQGSVFKVYLPAWQGEPSPAQPETAVPEPPRGVETVLWVDDEATLRELGQDILGAAGYQVKTAASGEEALGIYRASDSGIDLVVLDLGMPGMGGQKCLERLLEFDPQAKVIIASGYSANGKLKGILKKGAADFLTKPYRAHDLQATIRRVLDE